MRSSHESLQNLVLFNYRRLQKLLGIFFILSGGIQCTLGIWICFESKDAEEIRTGTRIPYMPYERSG